MKRRCLSALAVACFLFEGLRVSAIREVVDDADISRALAIANGPSVPRAQFHRPYVLPLKNQDVEQIEIITEFRRFVLAAEQQVKLGNWMMARGGYDRQGRTLKDMLKPLTGQVVIQARLRFHPLNNYGQVPPIDILLGEPTLLTTSVTRTPNLSVASREGKNLSVIAGAMIEAAFNAPSIADQVLAARVVLAGRELARMQIDFSKLD